MNSEVVGVLVPLPAILFFRGGDLREVLLPS